MRFINIAVIFVAIVPSVLSQVDGDPLDSAINTNVYPPPTATPADISGHDGASPYYITATDKSVPTGSAGTKNILGTYLYGYHGCNKINRAYKRNIDEAYYDSWTIASTPGVLSDINWNEAVSYTVTGSTCSTQLTHTSLILSFWAPPVLINHNKPRYKLFSPT